MLFLFCPRKIYIHLYETIVESGKENIMIVTMAQSGPQVMHVVLWGWILIALILTNVR